jgi:hypothetical protein
VRFRYYRHSIPYPNRGATATLNPLPARRDISPCSAKSCNSTSRHFTTHPFIPSQSSINLPHAHNATPTPHHAASPRGNQTADQRLQILPPSLTATQRQGIQQQHHGIRRGFRTSLRSTDGMAVGMGDWDVCVSGVEWIIGCGLHLQA